MVWGQHQVTGCGKERLSPPWRCVKNRDVTIRVEEDMGGVGGGVSCGAACISA